MNISKLETIAILFFISILVLYFGICTIETIENLITFGALPMTNLSKLIPTRQLPDFSKFPYEHDFVLNGRPQSFKRNLDGSKIIEVGTEVVTSYGVGYVERRHVDGSYIVRITEFDESVEVSYYADPVEAQAFNVVRETVTGREHVANLSSTYNNRLMNSALWFENRMRDAAHAELLMDLVIDSDCYQVSITGGDYCGATLFEFAPAVNPVLSKKNSKETRAYRAKVQAMADSLLADSDDDSMPVGMEDELAECFGE